MVVETGARADDEDTAGREEDAAGKVMWTTGRRWRWKQEEEKAGVASSLSSAVATGRGEEQN